jgi:RNA polymerase sigma factor (TIGR02999 family)
VSDSAQITALLQSWQDGDYNAQEQLFHLVHRDLRKIAANRLKNELRPNTLQATDLVHEIYPQLARQRQLWKNRGQFFAIASECMRRHLVDHARARTRNKRGGDAVRLSLSDLKPTEICRIDQDEEILAVDRSLTRLAELDETAALVIKHRYFGGMKREEIAEILEVSPSTVDRTYRFAKAWLKRELTFEFSPYLLSDGQILDKPGFFRNLKSEGGNSLALEWRKSLPKTVQTQIDATQVSQIPHQLLLQIIAEINKALLGKLFTAMSAGDDLSEDKTALMPEDQITYNRRMLEQSFPGQILKLT